MIQYPRRAVSSSPGDRNVKYWEQKYPGGPIVYIDKRDDSEQPSSFEDFDKLLATPPVKEVFDHLGYPRYFDAKCTPGVIYRRQYDSPTATCKWADGHPKHTPWGKHTTIDTILTDPEFIEVDARGERISKPVIVTPDDRDSRLKETAQQLVDAVRDRDYYRDAHNQKQDRIRQLEETLAAALKREEQLRRTINDIHAAFQRIKDFFNV